MAIVLLDVPIRASPGLVFEAVSTPPGLDRWWTKRSSGTPAVGAEFELWFGPDYDWRARVVRFDPDREFELEMTRADRDWTGTLVGFVLEPHDEITWLRFSHQGWPESNDHYRISCNCWAMYLRVLRRNLEYGETVPYEQRLEV
jgi:uncharacterized protein YndB with AHSA1/START domain